MFRSFIKSIKIYSAIFSLLAFTPLWATDDIDGERQPILKQAKQSVIQQQSNENDAYDDQRQPTPRSYEELVHSLTDWLNKHRLMWYMGFASTGCGLLVSNAFDIESQEMYTPWILGGLAVGLTAGATTKYFINKNCPGAENILKKRGPNIAAGLSSFIPWIIFGATQRSISH